MLPEKAKNIPARVVNNRKNRHEKYFYFFLKNTFKISSFFTIFTTDNA